VASGRPYASCALGEAELDFWLGRSTTAPIAIRRLDDATRCVFGPGADVGETPLTSFTENLWSVSVDLIFFTRRLGSVESKHSQ
jgi:hypothetical protein